jgi:protein-L-isoaspartate O-methyltransferase
VPQARTVLELGSGTGRHGGLLAAMGFDVFGIERSFELIAQAANSGNGSAFLTCEQGGPRHH